MSKLKLPIIIVAVIAAAAGALFFTGVLGGGEKEAAPVKKHVVPPVPLAETLTVNTANTDSDSYLLVGLALQLEPMDDETYANFTGGTPGAVDGPGAVRVSTYPKFTDAVIETAASFNSKQLRTVDGKRKFKEALLARFAEIAEVDAAARKAAPENPAAAGVEPPYKVMAIDFTQFAVQDR